MRDGELVSGYGPYSPRFEEREGMTQHVYPTNDLREHEMTPDCWCKPEIDEYGNVIHNSMDERETYEEGRKLQ